MVSTWTIVILWILAGVSYALRAAWWSTEPQRDIAFVAGISISAIAFLAWPYLSAIEATWCGYKTTHRILYGDEGVL